MPAQSSVSATIPGLGTATAPVPQSIIAAGCERGNFMIFLPSLTILQCMRNTLQLQGPTVFTPQTLHCCSLSWAIPSSQTESHGESSLSAFLMGPQGSGSIRDIISHILSAVSKLLHYELSTHPTELGVSLTITALAALCMRLCSAARRHSPFPSRGDHISVLAVPSEI